MSLDPKTTTLEEAQNWLRARLPEGQKCPCCQQHAKIYKRKLNSGMAASLIAFAKVTMQMQPKEGWLKVPDDFVETSKLITVLSNREYNKLRFWGLLEGFGLEPDSEVPFTGKWRITNAGLMFVRGEATVPKHIYLYDNRKMKPPESAILETISIKDALGSKFNYDELMENAHA